MAFQQYLADEVAIDHADGVLSRREALRRLALLGLGVPAASALLAACGYPALAVDLLSAEDGTAALGDEAAAGLDWFGRHLS